METREGFVVKQRVNIGSKSEMDGYFLRQDDGTITRIEFAWESPFQQDILEGLVGLRCEVEGSFYRDKFIVHNYREFQLTH